jgi:hypothetical protein
LSDVDFDLENLLVGIDEDLKLEENKALGIPRKRKSFD